jgi:thioredoxin-like negative regulator of GroEL
VERFSQGQAEAVRQSKPMLLFFTADWCAYCRQMAAEAFTHPQVVSLSGQFVCVRVDADAEPQVCRQFEVTGYPTIQFLSPRGVPLNRMVGKQPGRQVMMAMQAALQHVARRSESGETRLH